MGSIRHFVSAAAIFTCFSTVLPGQGYNISVKVPDAANKEIILSHRFGLKFYTDDTVKTDETGKAVFQGFNPLPEGMYQIVLPDKKFGEFFLGKNQVFSVSTRASAPTDSLSFEGSPENSLFLAWQQNFASARNRMGGIQNHLKKGNLTPDSSRLLNQELQLIQQATNKMWDNAISDLANTLPGSFIKGIKPVKVPESLVKPGSPDGQLKQYRYIRTHFFDDIDFSDERLLRTPLIETKMDQYFKQVVPPAPDTIILEARQLIERSKPAKTVFQFVVQYLFNLYSEPEIMGTDAVYVYIAENYYLTGQASWIDSSNLQGIRSRVRELKPLLLGTVPPDLEGLVTPDNQPVEIKDIKSKYLMLYFWSPDCGFCKEATPKLYKQYADLRQSGMEIVAINTKLENNLWTKFIADNQLDWINAWCPQKVREMIDKYQALTTPVLYILDPQRRIIAKNISVDQVKPFFTQYLSTH